VLRNLSWRADSASKDALQQTNVVQSLITMSMETHRESTLKSMLSALWNLSSHSSCNKATICATPGSLEFLVRTLTYKSESKTLSIVESGGGIVRNISSHIATRDDYRATLRRHGCFQILLHHLRSPSLTVVSNACGTLWNLSARCKEDQSTLRDLGAIPMLRNLVHSRHKMIATASSAALKNLESGGFGSSNGSLTNSGNASSHNTSLQARKQKALEQEIDQTLTEMCDNIDPLSPLEEPTGVSPFDRRMYRSLGGHNTTSLYGRASTAPTLVPKSGSTPIRPIRSSSLERKNAAVDAIANASGGSGGVGCPRTMTPSVSSAAAAGPSAAMGSRLQATRTVWHSHENEISYTSLNYEEDDQPVNYSLKYTEEVVSVPVATHWTPSRPIKAPVDGDNNTEGSDPILQSGDQMNPSTVKKAMVLSAYRETDLDEPERPTDFSLRYPDEDEDYAADSDTMQTYCMEGTPYETPFTRSSAASLSDLREAGLESPKMEPDDTVEKVDGLEAKPNCEEDADEEEEAEGDKEVEGKTPPMPRRLQPANKESKTVTFNTTADCEINYSEQQTPLMFSRSSSLESLDSLDQQQNCHDEGSVVSEFSRLTSRAVSPSELPDSPGQTMPSSPRRPQAHHPQSQQDQQQQQHQQHQMQHQQHQMQQQQQQQLPKPLQRVQHAEGVFEDTTNNFGMEGTPAFTRAASPLSQLSFDDEHSSPTNPTPPPPPPPPVVIASRPPMPAPSSVPASASSASSQLVNPTFNRVIRSASEVNFRSTFDYDEV
jgi:adenomatosis polyposis coli protein